MVVSASSPAAASPPEVSFATATTTIPAFLRNYCWSAYDPPFIRQECLRGDVPVPEGKQLSGLSSVQWAIEHPQKPDEIELVYWKRDQWTRPKRPHEIQVTSEQAIDGTGVRSVISFDLPNGWRNLSLELRAGWNIEASCPTCGEQWGLWRITLRK
jgi:hypothetical protein